MLLVHGTCLSPSSGIHSKGKRANFYFDKDVKLITVWLIIRRIKYTSLSVVVIGDAPEC